MVNITQDEIRLKFVNLTRIKITALIEGAGLWNTVQNYHIVDIHRQF